jgi:hypothetical protein
MQETLGNQPWQVGTGHHTLHKRGRSHWLYRSRSERSCSPPCLHHPPYRCCHAALSMPGGSRTRELLQQTDPQEQYARQQLLSPLSDDPQDDPFAGAHSDKNSFLGRLVASLPKTLQQHLQLLKHSLARAAADHPGSGHAHAAQLHHRCGWPSVAGALYTQPSPQWGDCESPPAGCVVCHLTNAFKTLYASGWGFPICSWMSA